MEQSAGQCGGYRYVRSRKSKTVRSIKKSKKGGARRRVKKTARKH